MNRIRKYHKNPIVGKTCDSGLIPTRLNVCPSARLILIASEIIMEARFLRSSNRMMDSDGHNLILGITIVSVEPILSASLRYSSKPKIISSRHRRPREANIFYVLLMASGRGSTINS